MNTDVTLRYQSAIDVLNALADVDGSELDWKYSLDNGSSKWTKVVNGTSYELTHFVNKSCSMYKTTGSGRRQKVNNGTMQSASSADVAGILGSY